MDEFQMVGAGFNTGDRAASFYVLDFFEKVIHRWRFHAPKKKLQDICVEILLTIFLSPLRNNLLMAAVVNEIKDNIQVNEIFVRNILNLTFM